MNLAEGYRTGEVEEKKNSLEQTLVHIIPSNKYRSINGAIYRTV